MASDDPAAAPPAWSAPQPPVVPTYDDTPVQETLEDLRVQESVVTQILDVLDEAGRAISDGQPGWVDPDVFGGTHKGERMARHTLRAQARVQRTLDMTLEALAQQYGSLSYFRGEVQRVESEGADQLAALKARLGDVAP